MNAYNITEFHKEWFEKRYIRVNDFRLNVLYGPETYCVSNLPRSHKNRLIKIYKEHIQWIRDHTVGSLPMLEPTEKDALVISDYEALIDFIDNTEPSHEWQDSWFKHFWTDKNRKENFFEVFPEYEDLKPILLSDLKDRWFDIPEQVLIEVKNIYED